MKFTVKTEKDIQEANLFPAGTYPFEVIAAYDAVSKAGADMIKLKNIVYLPDGEQRIVFDYLLDALPHKIRHLCEVGQIMTKYDSGSLEAGDLIGIKGNAKIVIAKGKNGYADSNSVSDYIVGDASQPDAKKSDKKKEEKPFEEDSIPF